MTEITIRSGIAKARMPLLKILLLGILAGIFLALGAHASSVAAHGIGNVGLLRLVTGCVFPIGLILIVIVGGELFTGNCLMVEGLAARHYGFGRWLRNLIPVFIGNFIGSLIVVILLVLANAFNYGDGALGAYAIKVALAKTNLPFLVALGSGILCNILVCVGVIGAAAAQDISGKVIIIWLPIMAFVLAGFEHCIANMYYILAGMFATLNPAYASKAQELYGITNDQLASLDLLALGNNLLPVTIGNVIGGVLVGLICYAAFKSRRLNPVK
ncbi:MAG: formate/nitrite transporter family protein [Coriobacteriales bacterium]|jgi:formate/nitrite transporter|nr:formate/nitrite transporter family protein [Coriobacteriales bacterium]